MTGFFILIFFVVIGPLAELYGSDSRVDDGRGWWPGTHGSDRVR